MKRILLIMLAGYPLLSPAAGRDMEKFTHMAGVNLSDYLDLKAITQLFGQTNIVRSGDAADYVGKACYLTKKKDAVLEFNESELYRGYEIRVPIRSDSQCAQVDKLDLKKLEVAGIRLGMSREEFDRVIENPRDGSDKVSQEWQYVDKKEDGEWHVYIYIRAHFAKGLLQSFSVDRGSSD
jgi:hypothetical protein